MRITNSELQNKINNELKKTTNLFVVSDGVCNKNGVFICKYDEILELFAGLHDVADVVESLTGVKVG